MFGLSLEDLESRERDTCSFRAFWDSAPSVATLLGKDRRSVQGDKNEPGG